MGDQGTYNISITLADDMFRKSHQKNYFNFLISIFYYASHDPKSRERDTIHKTFDNNGYLDWTTFNNSRDQKKTNNYRYISPGGKTLGQSIDEFNTTNTMRLFT